MQSYPQIKDNKGVMTKDVLTQSFIVNCFLTNINHVFNIIFINIYGPFLNCEVQEKLPISGFQVPHRSASRISLGALAIMVFRWAQMAPVTSPLPPRVALLFSARFGCASLHVECLRIRKNSTSDVLRDRDRESMTFIYHNYVHILHVNACS